MSDADKRATALMAAAQYVRNHRHDHGPAARTHSRDEDCVMWKQLVAAFDGLQNFDTGAGDITSPGVEPTNIEASAEKQLSAEVWGDDDGGCITIQGDSEGWPRSRPPL